MGYITFFDSPVPPGRKGVSTAPAQPCLIDPRFEHDSCGVGFVATLSNQASHEILAKALTALARLAHRGAVAADGKSSDGVGICTAIPRDLLLASTGITIDPDAPFAVGVVFFPSDAAESHAELEDALARQNCEVLAWRDVPTHPEILGEIALSTMPVIRHVLISSKNADHLNRRLYLARKEFERSGAPG